MNPNIAQTITLRFTRLIHAPRDRVFAAWTTPADIIKWFGPETCRTLSAKIDLRVGGEYVFHLTTDDYGEVDLRGVFWEVKAPARLVYTWNWTGNPKLEINETLVTVDFLDRNGSTEVQIVHDRLPNKEAGAQHTYGWGGCLDNLETHAGVK